MDRTKAARTRLFEAEAWVFDLDNTLYPASSNLFQQVDRRMTLFIAEFLSLDSETAYKLQKTYFREHGTTMRGLMNVHGIDPGPFLEFVHDIDLAPVAPDPALDAALTRLKGRKIVFTNGPTDHALRVMDRLAVRRHFEAVFDIVEADYVPKPEPRAYEALVRRYGLNPTTTVMVEDLARNLAPAAAMGMTTVWVRSPLPGGTPDAGNDAQVADHVIDDLSGWLGELTAAASY
ncbi:MAG: pyrimidine 5'-nucleotidase [Rhodospirillales bacterium]|nr:pyrimidine 5'-nucleotidase [Rhodospirillales bacterium]